MTYKTKRRWAKSLLFFSLLFVFSFSSLAQLISPALGPTQASAQLKKKADQNSRTILYGLAHCFEILKDSSRPDYAFSKSSMTHEEMQNAKTIQDASVSDNVQFSEPTPVGYEVDAGDGNADCNNILLSHLKVINKDSLWFFQQIYTTKDPDKLNSYQRETDVDEFKKVLDSVGRKILGLAKATGPVSQDEKERRLAVAFFQCNEVASGSTERSDVVKYNGKKYAPKNNDPHEVSVGYDLESSNGKFECDTLLRWGNKAEMERALKKYGASAQQAAEAGDETSGGGDEPTLECDTKFFNPLSWISCPLIDGLSTVVGELDSLITSQLSAGSPGNGDNPSQIFCSSETESADLEGCEAYHQAWTVFRNMALGLLVVIGLLIILSEMAGMEIFDAYTIRKTLPRLVVGAIGISLSWQLMQFLVEFTNALGYGIRFLIYQPFVNTDLNTAVLGGGGQGAVSLLAIGGLFLLGVIGMMSFVATAAIGVIVAFLTLVVREIIIIACVIIAPIAIVLYILPNTERFYKMWWDTFFKALMMFPLIAAMIASGRVFAAIASSNDSTISNILGFAAYFAPYFLLPMTFKYAGAAIAGIGGFLNNNELTNTGRKGLAQYRARKRQENMQKAKSFERFGTGNSFTRGMSTVAGAAFNPKSMMSKKPIEGIRSKRFSAMMATGAEALKNDEVFQQNKGNDSFLMALANRGLAKQKLDASRADRDKYAEQAAALKQTHGENSVEYQEAIASRDAAEQDMIAREHGLALAGQVSSRNDVGARLQATTALSQTGYQWGEGEEGYQELHGTLTSILGNDKGAVADAMDTNQYHLKNAGRSDLAGINHGAGHDIKSGIRKLTSYQRGSSSKPTTYKGGFAGFVGRGKDAEGKHVKQTPENMRQALSDRLASADTPAKRDAAISDIAEWRGILKSDLGSATDANAAEIRKQLGVIDGFAGEDGGPADQSGSTPQARLAKQQLQQAIAQQDATLAARAEVPEAEREAAQNANQGEEEEH